MPPHHHPCPTTTAGAVELINAADAGLGDVLHLPLVFAAGARSPSCRVKIGPFRQLVVNL